MNLSDFPLWTALITPMNEDGSVQFDDLEKLVRQQEKAGNGILLIGSTGEGLALKESEKRDIVDAVCAMKPKVPLMAGVGGFQLDVQKEWIKYCNEKPLDAFLLVTPLYAKPGAVGQLEWFTGLMDAAAKPCMIYNIPSRTGTKLPVNVLKDLIRHDRYWSMKEASGSVDEYQRYRRAAADHPIFSGDDGLYPFYCAAGCEGLVSVASNVWPEATRSYVQLGRKGQLTNLLKTWKPATDTLFTASNPVPVKRLLAREGVISSDTVRPPLAAGELKSDEELVQAHQNILNWYQINKNSL